MTWFIITYLLVAVLFAAMSDPFRTYGQSATVRLFSIWLGSIAWPIVLATMSFGLLPGQDDDRDPYSDDSYNN